MYMFLGQVKSEVIYFHAIRHLSVSMLYKLGYPASEIQAILRHKSPNTTALYIKKLDFEKVVREALEDISRQKGRIVEFKLRQVYGRVISSQKERAVSGAVNS